MINRLAISAICILILGCCAVSYAESPGINVVYPKNNGNVAAVDSTFILGSVTPGSVLEINGVNVTVHKDGGFIAFLPINPGRFDFEITAIHGSDTAMLLWPVNVPLPDRSYGYDSLVISDRTDAFGNVILTAGDRLRVDFKGTPGCIAYFSIPGYVDSVPMAEMTPQAQPYWGESVFGIGAVPDSMKIKGYYSGYLDIGSESLLDSSRIKYHLLAPGLSTLLQRLLVDSVAEFDFGALALLKLQENRKIDSSYIFVQINPGTFPRVVEFTDSVQTVRVGPRKGYLSIFQPEGVRALAVGREGDWIKLRLSETQYGWVSAESIRFLDPSLPPPRSYLTVVRTNSEAGHLTVEFSLAGRHPFRVEEEDARTIKVYLYGVTSDTDWIRYDFGDKSLELATWEQIEPELYCLKLYFKYRIWGYDFFYDGNTLKLQINKPPQHVRRLRDKVIVIDPGHSPDPGAIGPTGLLESEANLAIALALKKELNKRGAKVILTREDMSDMPLYDRPKIAKAHEADLFVSIHNNALPDGVNPFVNNGTSTYYYHPHSIELARAIQTEMLKATHLNDYGLYYGNLAVNRPTQYPAVLVECAFIILPEQEAMLKKDKFQKKLAGALRKGIERFLEGYNDEQ
jgi:N-acetylmuramoyl-L-alanine amidase